MLDPRNGPEGDLAAPDVPVRTWVLASTPRTGSTVLCRSLWDTGLVGAPKEYLNPMQVRDWEVRFGSAASRWGHRPLRGPLLALAGRGRWSDARLWAYLERVRARRTGPTGWFGLKVHHHHFRRWFLDQGRAPEAFLGPVTWLRIVREDRVAQAVSWARALQTGRWAAHQRGWLPPLYRRDLLDRCLRRIAADEAAWDAWFAARGIAPHPIRYEDVAGDLPGVVRGVLGFLDVPGAAAAAVPGPDFAPQADPVSARWRDRFMEGR